MHLGMEGPSQQFDRAILAGTRALPENGNHRTQSARSRTLNAKAEWNILFVRSATLGNLQQALDQGPHRAQATLYSLRFIFPRRGIGTAANHRIRCLAS